MNESFDKIKKRAWTYAMIKCVLAGAAAALLTVNAVLLPCLLCGVHLLWAWYVLIAVGGFALGGGIAFLFFRVDDGKLAKRVDSELGLKERVQTAYVYRDGSGSMLELQRADAQAALDGAPAERKKLLGLNVAVTAALAAALALCACALPVIAVYADTSAWGGAPTVPVDPPRDVTDWEWQALDELIAYVNASTKADAAAKAGMLAALNGLRNVLLGGVTQSGLPVFVRNAVTEIRNAVSDANAQSGVTEAQQQANSEEEEYVVAKLNEIFGLQQSGGDDPTNPGGNDNPEQPVSPGNNTGTGELVISGVPFFDPELGYVSSGDTATREKYYAVIRQAMLEGTISRSEWELIVAQYFADLKNDTEESA